MEDAGWQLLQAEPVLPLQLVIRLSIRGQVVHHAQLVESQPIANAVSAAAADILFAQAEPAPLYSNSTVAAFATGPLLPARRTIGVRHRSSCRYAIPSVLLGSRNARAQSESKGGATLLRRPYVCTDRGPSFRRHVS